LIRYEEKSLVPSGKRSLPASFTPNRSKIRFIEARAE
jgi:hypothetical protein